MNSFCRLSISAFGIAALLTISGWAQQKNLNNLKWQLSNIQQQLQEAKSSLNDSEQEIHNLRQQLNQKNSEITTMSICLEGVGRALSDMGDGNRPGAFLNLSSVVQECRQSDSIAEKVRFQQNHPSVTTHISIKNVSHYKD